MCIFKILKIKSDLKSLSKEGNNLKTQMYLQNLNFTSKDKPRIDKMIKKYFSENDEILLVWEVI